MGKEVNIEFFLTCKRFIVMRVDGMGMLPGEVAVGMGRYQGPMDAGTEWAGGQSFKKKNHWTIWEYSATSGLHT